MFRIDLIKTDMIIRNRSRLNTDWVNPTTNMIPHNNHSWSYPLRLFIRIYTNKKNLTEFIRCNALPCYNYPQESHIFQGITLSRCITWNFPCIICFQKTPIASICLRLTDACNLRHWPIPKVRFWFWLLARRFGGRVIAMPKPEDLALDLAIATRPLYMLFTTVRPRTRAHAVAAFPGGGDSMSIALTHMWARCDSFAATSGDCYVDL